MTTMPSGYSFADTGQLAVARTMPVPFTAAIAAACNDDVMDVVAPREGLWQRDATGPFGRSDLAAASTSGRLRVGRRAVRVDIQLAPWSDSVTELVLRPSARGVQHWSGRRRRLWYDAAHTAADALRHNILEQQPASVRRRWVTEVADARRRLAG